MTIRILQGDARDTLAELPDGCAQLCVTSPPYWALRSYLPADHPDKPREIGSEPTPAAFVENLMGVFDAVRRVLRDDGVCVVNLGETWASPPVGRFNGGGFKDGSTGRDLSGHASSGSIDRSKIGIPTGNVVGIPFMFAFAMRERGWIWRDTLIWAKPSAMPASLNGWRFFRCQRRISRDEYETMLAMQASSECSQVQKGPNLPAMRTGGGEGVSENPSISKGSRALSKEREGSCCRETTREEAVHHGAAPGLCEKRGGQGVEEEIPPNREGESKATSAHKSVAEDKKRQGVPESGRQKTIKSPPPQGTQQADQAKKVGGRSAIQGEREGQAQTMGQQSGRADMAKTEGAEATSIEAFDAGGCTAHSERVAGDIECGEREMPLLQEEDAADNGPCDSTKQGRRARKDKHCGSVPDVQFEETGPGGDTVLIDCPGCPKCSPHGGYVLRRGSLRSTTAHEYLFIFAKSAGYYGDREGWATPAKSATLQRNQYTRVLDDPDEQYAVRHDHEFTGATANLRSVLTIGPEPTRQGHYAAFPQNLVIPFIKAFTSERGCCATCGSPWSRVVELSRSHESGSGKSGNPPQGKNGQKLQGGGDTGDVRNGPCVAAQTLGWRPTCEHDGEPVPCTVIDPFGGTGTTGIAANMLGRDAILCELNSDYIQMIHERCEETAPLLLNTETA